MMMRVAKSGFSVLGTVSVRPYSFHRLVTGSGRKHTTNGSASQTHAVNTSHVVRIKRNGSHVYVPERGVTTFKHDTPPDFDMTSMFGNALHWKNNSIFCTKRCAGIIPRMSAMVPRGTIRSPSVHFLVFTTQDWPPPAMTCTTTPSPNQSCNCTIVGSGVHAARSISWVVEIVESSSMCGRFAGEGEQQRRDSGNGKQDAPHAYTWPRFVRAMLCFVPVAIWHTRDITDLITHGFRQHTH
jgi:hypothetical protein